MSITASTPSKRLPLASLSVNINLPLLAKRLQSLGLPRRLLPLTPRSKALPLRPSSFSDYRILNNKLAAADLAATKLKLKLQLAFYKLQLRQKRLPDPETDALDVSHVSNASVSTANTSVGSCNDYKLLANVNLLKGIARRLHKPSLLVVANKNTSKLRLFHIKKGLSFYGQAPRPPLSQTEVRLPRPHWGTSQRLLPPINRILKTPIKTASSTRALVHAYNANGSAKPTNTDETIDELQDDTLLELKVRRKDILLSSLPIKDGSFGTPNSFSVAKSLLQLGLGYY